MDRRNTRGAKASTVALRPGKPQVPGLIFQTPAADGHGFGEVRSHSLGATVTAGILQPFAADQSIPKEKITALDRRYAVVIQALDDLVEAVGLRAAQEGKHYEKEILVWDPIM
jgi:hypothetical protein